MTFKEYLDHESVVNQLKSILDDQQKKIQQNNDYFSEVIKMFSAIEKTLEYGLKEESKLKEAVAKVLSIAKHGTNIRPNDFSSWNRMNSRGSHYSPKEQI